MVGTYDANDANSAAGIKFLHNGFNPDFLHLAVIFDMRIEVIAVYIAR